MIHLPYKLIATDVDGTLINREGKLTPAVKEALIEAQRDWGIKVAIASGRPTFALQELAEELRLAQYGGYLLPFNGGQIYEANTSRLIGSTILDEEIIKELYELSQEIGLNLITYSNSHIYSEIIDNPYVQKEVELTQMPTIRVKNFLDERPHNLPKCLAVGREDLIELGDKLFNERFQGRISAFRSSPYFLELVPFGMNKGKALQSLLQRLKLQPKDMIAFGDNYNDLEMISLAGLGVAMSNAPEPIRKIADDIAPSNNEDGIATYLRSHIFG